MTIDLSIIIVSHNNLLIVCNCLDSIFLYNDIDNKLEIIVVDNSDNDLIYSTLKSKYKSIHTYHCKNEGFGKANNIGCEKANGKYLLFLNPDTIFINNILKKAIEKFEQDKDLVMFGVKLINLNHKPNLSFFYIDKYNLIYNILLKLFNKMNIFIDGKMYITGADIFIRKRIFNKIGMFDEKIFMYYEEADLVKRIKLNSTNNKISFFKEMKIIHLEGGTTPISSDSELVLKLERDYESLKYYCKKYKMSLKKSLLQRYQYEILKLTLIYIFNNKIIKNQTKIKIKYYKKKYLENQ